jgi:hypothetical protein
MRAGLALSVAALFLMGCGGGGGSSTPGPEPAPAPAPTPTPSPLVFKNFFVQQVIVGRSLPGCSRISWVAQAGDFNSSGTGDSIGFGTQLPVGATVTVSFDLVYDYCTFVEWSGGCAGAGASCSFVVPDGETTIEARFTAP